MKRIVKFLMVIFLVFSAFFTSAYRFYLKKNRPLLLFNARPITAETINYTTRYFKTNQKVYFALVNPLGFKDDHIRVQLVKKEEKTQHWGYKVYWAKDYQVEKGEKSFVSYIVVPEKGYYFLQIFEFHDFDWPIARNDFWVSE